MLVIYKGKGILIPVFFIVSFISVAILAGVLKRNVGGIFAQNYSFFIGIGLSAIITGIWTRFASKDFIKKDGKKVEIDLDHSFFFIKMKILGYILCFLGVIVVCYGLYDTIINLQHFYTSP